MMNAPPWIHTALRAHLEQKLLFGQRREDKHAKP